MTLIELLVAAMMSVIIVGAVVRDVDQRRSRSAGAQQEGPERRPRLATQLERMIARDPQRRPGRTFAELVLGVSFVARVRRATCGGAAQTGPQRRTAIAVPGSPTAAATSTCTRIEAEWTSAGAPATSSIAPPGSTATEVFCFVPSANDDSTECGQAQVGEMPAANLRRGHPARPEPGRHAVVLTISDGASAAQRDAHAAFDLLIARLDSWIRCTRGGGRSRSIEVLVAAMILALAAMATFGVLSAATRNAQRAKATQVALDTRPGGDGEAAQPSPTKNWR